MKYIGPREKEPTVGKKDKEGKKDKSAASGGDEFARPSEAKGGGDGWNFEKDENIGKLYIITPLREEEHDDSFNPGTKKQHIVADIVEVDEDEPGDSELHSDAWVFGGWTRGALRDSIGTRRVLGRLQRDKSKARGNNIPWVLKDASDNDIAAARAYLASLDPFATSK